MIYLITQTLNGLFSAALLFLIAGGLTLVFGVMRIVNIAHGSFYMLGVYIAYTVIAPDAQPCCSARWRRSWWWAPSASWCSVVPAPLRRPAAGADDDDHGICAGVSRCGVHDLGRRPVHAAVPGGAARLVEAGDIVFPRYRLFVMLVAALVGVALWIAEREDADRRETARDGRRSRDGGGHRHQRGAALGAGVRRRRGAGGVRRRDGRDRFSAATPAWISISCRWRSWSSSSAEWAA